MINSFARQLRGLLAERSAPIAPGVFDGVSAKLTAAAGFRVAYMSGAAAAAAVTGLPDIGLATQTELVNQVALLSRCLDIPLVADADTGFGDVTHAYRTVQLYERAGATAIQLEDQEFPKRCGHLASKRVVPAGDFARKVEAATEARRDPDTVIIARTDARACLGFEEAVRRINLYAEAGADMVFLEAPQSAEEVLAVPGAVKAPALFNHVTRGKTPPVTLDQLRVAGYALVIMPGLNSGSAARAMQAALARAARGDLTSDDQDSPQEKFTALGLDFWEDLRGRYETEAG